MATRSRRRNIKVKTINAARTAKSYGPAAMHYGRGGAYATRGVYLQATAKGPFDRTLSGLVARQHYKAAGAEFKAGKAALTARQRQQRRNAARAKRRRGARRKR